MKTKNQEKDLPNVTDRAKEVIVPPRKEASLDVSFKCKLVFLQGWSNTGFKAPGSTEGQKKPIFFNPSWKEKQLA